MPIRQARARGVSLLLEIVVGLGIFLVAFLLVYGVFPMSQRALAEARNQLVANSIAREFLEAERDKRLSRVAHGQGEIVVSDSRRGDHTVEGRESDVEYLVTISGRDGPVDGTREVTVLVEWSYGGLRHQTSLESIVAARLGG